jgi:hypothetical protein
MPRARLAIAKGEQFGALYVVPLEAKQQSGMPDFGSRRRSPFGKQTVTNPSCDGSAHQIDGAISPQRHTSQLHASRLRVVKLKPVRNLIAHFITKGSRHAQGFTVEPDQALGAVYRRQLPQRADARFLLKQGARSKNTSCKGLQ